MRIRDDLLSVLADGCFHSGQSLGTRFGMSRSAINKHMQAIEALGLSVQAVTGKGYRLARRLELLDAQRILAYCGDGQRDRLTGIEILCDVDSTNRYLLEAARQRAPSGRAVFAERQWRGRGRRGRDWQSPFGENLYFSFLWRSDAGIEGLAGLTLAIGVAVARTAGDLGLQDVGLKWPNDVLWNDRKLAGVLVEVAGEAQGPCAAVIGVGLNLFLPRAAAARVTQPWIDVETAIGRRVSRNEAAGRLVHHILEMLPRFEQSGLTPFLADWRALDCVRDRRIDLHSDAGVMPGIARGVDDSGALLVDMEGQRRRFAFGEISLRLAGDVTPPDRVTAS